MAEREAWPGGTAPPSGSFLTDQLAFPVEPALLLAYEKLGPRHRRWNRFPPNVFFKPISERHPPTEGEPNMWYNSVLECLGPMAKSTKYCTSKIPPKGPRVLFFGTFKIVTSKAWPALHVSAMYCNRPDIYGRQRLRRFKTPGDQLVMPQASIWSTGFSPDLGNRMHQGTWAAGFSEWQNNAERMKPYEARQQPTQ